MIKQGLRTTVPIFFVFILFGCSATQPNSNFSLSNEEYFGYKKFDRTDFNISKSPNSLKKISYDEILHDPLKRISKDFHAPKNLQHRVKFWMDIYSKFGKYEHVIHHSKYPWIVLDVINTTDIYSQKGHKWTKYHRAKKLVAKRRSRIKRALYRLSKKKSFKRMTKLQMKLYKNLKSIPGNRNIVFRDAAKHLRVQLGQKDFFVEGLERSSKYLPFMEREFLRLNLPTELTRLPFVESSFNEKAQSSVGASGIWQIMPRTGSQYGRVGKYIDERNSPFKATTMAGRLLRFYHKSFKKWPLAVTAYNNGFSGVKKAIKRARSKRLGSIIAKNYKGSFKFASSNFYTSFLAALHVYEYRKELLGAGMDNFKNSPHSIILSKSISVKKLLTLAEVDRNIFLALNLDLKKALAKNKTLPKGLRIFLPESPNASLLKVARQVRKSENNQS